MSISFFTFRQPFSSISAELRLDRLKNRGFDYEGKIFEKSLSPMILNDPNRREILSQYERIVQFLIEKTKTIKTFINYTVDKDYNKIN